MKIATKKHNWPVDSWLQVKIIQIIKNTLSCKNDDILPLYDVIDLKLFCAMMTFDLEEISN